MPLGVPISRHVFRMLLGSLCLKDIFWYGMETESLDNDLKKKRIKSILYPLNVSNWVLKAKEFCSRQLGLG